MKETIFDNMFENLSSAGEAWNQYGIQDGRQTRKPHLLATFLFVIAAVM